MMVQSPHRLPPCRPCHENFGDTGSKELPQRCHFVLEFSFSLNNRACQQLAKLMLLWRREEEEVEVEVIEWGVRWLKPFLVLITRFRLSKGVTALLSPLASRGPSIY